MKVQMKIFFRLSVIFLFTDFKQLLTEKTDASLVNFYVSLINNRTKAALEYAFPTDARMHEASDKYPQGKFDFISGILLYRATKENELGVKLFFEWIFMML